jgi:transposase-like protein
MPKGNPGRPKKRYTGEFKQKAVEHMRENGLSYRETGKLFGLKHDSIIIWERVYLEEGAEGLYIDRRGRVAGSPPKISKEVEEDLIAENQRLRMENDYLKKLDALVRERELREKKRR